MEQDEVYTNAGDVAVVVVVVKMVPDIVTVEVAAWAVQMG